MSTRKFSKHLLRAAAIVMMFGAATVHAQTSQSTAGATTDYQTGKSGAASSGTSSGTTSGATSTSATGASSLSKADQKLIQEIAQANIAEIEAGKLALSKTQNEQVKSFAQKMIDDHSKAQQDLQRLAQAKGVTLPTTPDAKHQTMMKKLDRSSGAEFDRLYLSQGGLADHKATHRLLQRVQSRAADADLKQYAMKILPTVNQHLNLAQQTRDATASGNKSAGMPAATGSTSSGASGTSGTESTTNPGAPMK